MGIRRGKAVCILIGLLSTANFLHARDLTFEERVKAQEAIERVYYSHQVGTTASFENVVPRSLLEKKVATYLKESIALEKYWNTPVTAAALEAELRRIADRTRFPDRLLEIYAALHNDSFLIQECFARPAIVDRLARNFWKSDPRWGQESAVPPAPDSKASLALPSPSGWDEWWNRVQSDLDERTALARANATVQLPRPDSTGSFTPDQVPVSQPDSPPCLPDDTWDNGILDDFPRLTKSVSAVWTGNRMILWGGLDASSTSLGGALAGGGPTNKGASYDPLIDSWTPTSVVGAPSAREGHTAVWTGTRMIVWGGAADDYLGTGGSYDPSTDSWTALSNSGASSPRKYHTAVWTGSRMIIWGGEDLTGYLGDGAEYNPGNDNWSSIPVSGAASPRSGHTAVWTGSLMIIWGGSAGNTGALFSPSPGHGSWTPVSQGSAPIAHIGHTAIWTGSRMVIWGGHAAGTSGPVDSGGLYDPTSGSWVPTSFSGVPAARDHHTAVWTGSRMLVWGGRSLTGALLNTGGSFFPLANSWTPLSSSGAPAGREDHVALWTGTLMLVWGGTDNTTPLDSGGRYDPVSNSWTPTARVRRPVLGPAVWTGNQMVIWSGHGIDASHPQDPGSRYDPLTDSWADISAAGAPARRFAHSAVWTGSRVVIWGGRSESQSGLDGLNTGGRYDPVGNAWSPMSVPALQGRGNHTAVWTGSRMLVWGGFYVNWFSIPQVGVVENTGGSYDPATNSWSLMATSGAPTARTGHTGVWTGSRWVIWGGDSNTGGRYDPSIDTWAPISLSGAPTARRDHAAVWTGSRMVIWGGLAAPDTYLDTGGRYDPFADSWLPTSISGASSPRSEAAIVWTGRQMLVWGGFRSGAGRLASGGRYDPAADSWLAMTDTRAPEPASPVAVWTGAFMLVYGGPSAGGGRYALDQGLDNDGDGISDCAGDCADNDPAIHPGAAETCNSLDDDCNGVIDDADTDADGFSGCGGPDCNDADPAIHPGAPETCNHVDEDCDGLVDEGFLDADGDGYAACAGDCNDSSFTIHPGATELCNQVDDDCDSLVDEGLADNDGDGFVFCSDCNDSNPSIHPGASEICNHADDDCNGVRDDGFPNVDGDGWAACAGDCNDTNPSVFPGAVEVCNGVDDNCNGAIDDRDADVDGFLGCGGPDCNDLNPAIHPGAAETCNGADDDCDLLVDEGFEDFDGDGVAACAGDCNDADPSAWRNPVLVTGFRPDGTSQLDWVWDSQAALIGPGVLYDVASGPITPSKADLSVGSCLATVSTPQFTDPQPNPGPPGWGYWFLVLAKNSCQAGSYGTSSLGIERPVPPCP